MKHLVAQITLRHADYNTDNTATCDFQAEMIQSEDTTSFEKSKRQSNPIRNGKLVQCPETKKFIDSMQLTTNNPNLLRLLIKFSIVH